MSEKLFVRDLVGDEGNRLLKIVRRDSGSVVTWRRAQIVLWSAQRYDVAKIAELAFTSPDRVRQVIHNFNKDGFDSLPPRYKGGAPPKFTLPERQEIKKIALSRPEDHGLPFSTWSLTKLTEFLSPRGWSTTSAMRASAFSSARRACRFKRSRPGSSPTTPTSK